MSTIPTDFLFRFRFSCRRWENASPDAVVPETLGAEFRVPHWSQIPMGVSWSSGANDPPSAVGVNPSNESLFDFRIGWAKEGLVFTVVVAGKDEEPYWTHSLLQRADGVRMCIDTRDLHDVHRGTRFCHKFAFFPFIGESADVAKPLAQWLPISRATDIPSSVDVQSFVMAAERRADGYAFSCFIPSSALTGFDPELFDRFGMHFVVGDSEHGAFTLQHSAPLPFEDDPTLWSSFVMLGADSI